MSRKASMEAATHRKISSPSCSQPTAVYGQTQSARKESTGRKESNGKKKSIDMSAGRRQSVTAQITRQARRLSAAIAPQLTKIELPMLMKAPGVTIQAKDNVQNYILHAATNFEPIDFLICDLNKSLILTAHVGANYVTITECGRKVCELSFGDMGDRPNLIAKIKHPVSGMVVNELVEFDSCIVVYNNTESAGARIEVVGSHWMAILAKCGCTFTAERWHIIAREQKVAEVSPISSLLQESSIEVVWENFCEMENRMVAMCFGLVQLIRKAYPPLLTIMHEHRRNS